jgi:hypothetical protein
MPFGAVQLVPGVNTEKTLSANQAGVSQSQLIRYKAGMIETQGGWQSILSVIPSTVRDLHAWEDVMGRIWLSAAATGNVVVGNLTLGSEDITPQTRTTNNAPSFSISTAGAGDPFQVTVRDKDSDPTAYNTVFFNTPVAVGNMLLEGAYQITSVLSTGSFTIESTIAASTTISSGGILPTFTTTSSSPIITVTLSNNTYEQGFVYSFLTPTTVDGQTVSGSYKITSVLNSTQSTITSNILSSAAATSTMNAGNAQLVYYVSIGPQAAGSGFGAGGFGSGGFGTGTGTVGTPGTPITATNWSQDNWGEILLACPFNGAIFQWSPESGFPTLSVVPTAPFFNGGIFISQPQQILVAWKSVGLDALENATQGTQNNLLVRWSDDGDFTNWVVSNQTSAGAFTLPTGSVIVGGLQAPNRGVIWTDIECWIMSWVGGDVIFNFTKIGTGCGLVGQHAANVIAGNVYWMGKSNFFMLGSSGVQPMPCTVWDFVFQNINTAQYSKVACAPNSAFNEISWDFPTGSATENNAYVKYNFVEGEWDYGLISRTAWTDVSVIGNPVGADPQGVLWQHEQGQVQSGTPVTSFRTGWFVINEGEELAFVDFVIPDFIWSTYSGGQNASISITFYVVDYPGQSPNIYGPYTVTQATQYITPRFRGRLMSVFIQSNNSVFWRIGRIRYRFAQSGRR